MPCKNCGGDMVGDGYTEVSHCENLDLFGQGYEPDANPVFCDYEDEPEIDPFEEDYLVESYRDPNIRE